MPPDPPNPMHLNRSRLVRSLSALSANDSVAPRPNLTERLGQWVGVGDAMALFSALNPGQAATRSASSVPGPADRAALVTETARLQQELAQLRSTLGKAIRADSVFKPIQRARPPSDTSGNTPGDEPGAPAYAGSDAAFEADFLPYRRACLLHQRTLATRIGAWRARVREVLAHGSAALQKLAALDAALEQALAHRERDLLSTLPALLEKRFNALQQVGNQAPAEPARAPDGAWLAQFRSEVQEVLLAELDLRLQPAEGLIAACLAETHQHHPIQE